MKKMHGIAPAAAITVALLALGGCASRGSVESLREEVASLRTAQQATDAKATNALATAQKAAADAAQAEASADAASQKADQIFRAGLRK
ncbi:MAG: alanine-zipper protein [Geminicoccaceae bacterium]